MKKHAKRIAAALLACLLTASLAACNGGGGGSTTSGGSSDSATTSDTGNGGDTGEIVTLTIWGFGSSDTEDCNEVAAAVSELTREKIGVEINLVRGQDGEQMNLALTSGEAIDLMNYTNISGQLTTLVKNGHATELDDLVEEYAQGALEVIDPVDLETCKINGILYALPNMKDTSRAAGVSMRKDILEQLNIDVSEMSTFEEVHDVLVQVRDSIPDVYPLVPSWAQGGMQSVLPVDGLTDNLGVLENVFDDSTEVVNWYATDTYREFCEMMYQWNQEGLIMPDATTTTENNLLSGPGFAMFENWKPGKELENYKANGKEVEFVHIVEPFKDTNTAQCNSYFIPYSSPNPEKAMQMWNLMYTDPDIANLLINGIEGKHWEYVDDTKEFITIPEGVDPNASGYTSVDWSWPNQQITPVWQGGEADLWDQLNEFNRSGHPSPAHGFTWDSSSVTNQITACQNVVSQYNTALVWGTLNPDETIPKFVAELEAAGINDIIKEKQRQLDEYLASQE